MWPHEGLDVECTPHVVCLRHAFTECVCQAVSQPWDRAVHRRPPCLQGADGGGGGRQCPSVHASGFYCMCPHGRRRGHSGVFSLYFPHLTCA